MNYLRRSLFEEIQNFAPEPNKNDVGLGWCLYNPKNVVHLIYKLEIDHSQFEELQRLKKNPDLKKVSEKSLNEFSFDLTKLLREFKDPEKKDIDADYWSLFEKYRQNEIQTYKNNRFMLLMFTNVFDFSTESDRTDENWLYRTMDYDRPMAYLDFEIVGDVSKIFDNATPDHQTIQTKNVFFKNATPFQILVRNFYCDKYLDIIYLKDKFSAVAPKMFLKMMIGMFARFIPIVHDDDDIRSDTPFYLESIIFDEMHIGLYHVFVLTY